MSATSTLAINLLSPVGLEWELTGLALLPTNPITQVCGTFKCRRHIFFFLSVLSCFAGTSAKSAEGDCYCEGLLTWGQAD